MSMSFNNPVKPPISGAARTYVRDRFDLTQNLAETMIDDANTVLSQLANIDLSVGESALSFDSGNLPPEMGEAPNPTRPSPFVSVQEDVSLDDLQGLKDALALSEVTLSVLDLPSFTKTAPEMTEYDDPTEVAVDVPDAVPELGTIDKPSRPDLSLPDASHLQALQDALDAIVIPQSPETQRVAFENVLQPWDFTPPDLMFVFSEGTYQSDLQDAINLALLSYVQNGGTGLDPDVEAALFARARNRLEDTRTRERDRLLNFWDQMGHDLPPGVLSAQLKELDTEHQKRESDLNRDILIQSSNLAAENTRFFHNAALQNEKMLSDYSNQMALRSFEAAKETVNTAVQGARLELEHRQSLREDQRLNAEVFREKVQAELTELQKARLELEGASLSAEIVNRKADLFLKRYEEAKILIALFAEEMKGAELEASLEQLKFQGFDSLLKTIQSKIAINTSRYNLTQAKWANNETKARVYSAEVEAHNKLVDGKRTEAEINIAQGEMTLKRNQQTIEILKSALQKFEAESRHQASLEESAVKAHNARTDQYKAELAALSDHYRSLVERYRAQETSDLGRKEMEVRQAEVNQRTATAIKEIAARALEALGNIKAQMGASALSSVSASAQMGYSESLGHSYSGTVSDSASRSYSENYSETHTYKESNG